MPLDDSAVTNDANTRIMIIEEIRQVLGDMVVGFDQLSDKIAECVAINRYLTVKAITDRPSGEYGDISR
jgi:hypothetical protein